MGSLRPWRSVGEADRAQRVDLGAKRAKPVTDLFALASTLLTDFREQPVKLVEAIAQPLTLWGECEHATRWQLGQLPHVRQPFYYAIDLCLQRPRLFCRLRRRSRLLLQRISEPLLQGAQALGSATDRVSAQPFHESHVLCLKMCKALMCSCTSSNLNNGRRRCC